MAPRTPLLFLAGAGLPAWIWDGVRDSLGGGTTTVPAGLGVDLRSAAVAAFELAPEGRFGIVAHGAAGVIAAEMARLDPESVAAIVGIAAVFPRQGRSYLDTVPFPASVSAKRAVKGGGVHPPLAKYDGGLDRATTARLRAETVNVAEGVYRDPLERLVLPERRAYVFTTADPVVPPELQRGFARVLDAATDTVGGGHLPMLEQPRQLAGVIERLLA